MSSYCSTTVLIIRSVYVDCIRYIYISYLGINSMQNIEVLSLSAVDKPNILSNLLNSTLTEAKLWYNCAQNIFEVCHYESDTDHYIIMTNLFHSIFNI